MPTTPQKIYVLDTNVLLNSPDAIFKFEEHIVIIPQPVLEELDGKKKEPGEIGYSARQFSRNIDKLRTQGNLTTGIKLNDQGGMLYIVLFDNTVANCLPYQDMSKMDNRILATAVYMKTFKFTTTHNIILVSKDTNVRIMADVFGIIAEDYKNDKVESEELYSGVIDVTVPQEFIDLAYKNGKLERSELSIFEFALMAYPNECFILRADSNSKQSVLVRYNSIMKEFRVLPQDMKTVDILPRNAEQQFALDMLKDPELDLVTMSGKAGSGKTLMALAAGLYGVIETQRYQKIILLKPIIAMDNSHELGFLPGGLDEKLGPWMASYADNIELIMQGYIKDTSIVARRPKGISKAEWETLQEKQVGRTNPIQELVATGLLEMGSLEHFRGRSLSNSYIICDESQNLNLNSMKTVVTRAGEGTKFVIMGDTSQIDSPYLDVRSNGLSNIIEKFKSVDFAGHISLKKSERSRLAEIASNIL